VVHCQSWRDAKRACFDYYRSSLVNVWLPWLDYLYGRKVPGISSNQAIEALSKGFNEHISDRALASAARTLSRYLLRPELKSILGILARPGFQPLNPYLPQKFLLQSTIATKLGCQFNVGHGTEDQARRHIANQALSSSQSKLGIVLSNIEEN
jgi:hypothetical protein